MLKKILPIFFILCLVFSLTVPCFAAKPGYYNQLSLYYNNYSIGGLTYTTDGKSFSVVGTVLTSPRYNQFVISRQITFKRDGTKYAIIRTPDPNIQIGISGHPSHPDSFIFSGTASSSWTAGLYLRVYDGDSFDLRNYFLNVVDLTAIYGRGNEPSSISQFLEDYPIFSQDVPYTQNSLMISDFYDPFLDFYSSLSHTFDFVPDLFSNTFVGLSVLIAAIVSILVVIFVVIFMIKRFTGGKS